MFTPPSRSKGLFVILITLGTSGLASAQVTAQSAQKGTATQSAPPNRPATTSGHQTAEKYELFKDRFGITAPLVRVRNMTQAGDCSGNIEGTVDLLVIARKPVELVTNDIVHDGGKDWIVTKQYGRIRISGGFVGDNPPNGLCFWTTPSQNARIRPLLAKEEAKEAKEAKEEAAQGAALNRVKAEGAELVKLVKAGDLATLRTHLSSGADPNVGDDSVIKGWTPLMAAAFSGNVDAVRLLLEARAAIDAKTVNGRTALDVAVTFGSTEVANYLRSHGAKCGECQQER